MANAARVKKIFKCFPDATGPFYLQSKNKSHIKTILVQKKWPDVAIRPSWRFRWDNVGPKRLGNEFRHGRGHAGHGTGQAGGTG
jgi:hypothetical protein